MKKTTFLRIFTLSLALILMLSLGLTACSDCSGCSPDTDAPPTTPGDDSATANEEEIFQAIKTAYQNFDSYSGEMYIEATGAESYGDESWTDTTKSYLNLATGEYLATDDTGCTDKLFSADGKYYKYTDGFYGDGSLSPDGGAEEGIGSDFIQAPIKEIPQEYLTKRISNERFSIFNDLYGEPFSANSLAELRSAYATVWAKDGYSDEDTAITVKIEDGKYILLIEVPAFDDDTPMHLTQKVAVADGKLVEVGCQGSMEEDGETYNASITIRISYQTGKDFYNSVSVPLPDDMNTIPKHETIWANYAENNGISVALRFSDGTLWGYFVSDYYSDKSFSQQFSGKLAYSYVSTWYTDEACTQPFDIMSSDEVWASVSTLYTNAEALTSPHAENIFLVSLQEKRVSNISDAYRIVFGTPREYEDVTCFVAVSFLPSVGFNLLGDSNIWLDDYSCVLLDGTAVVIPDGWDPNMAIWPFPIPEDSMSTLTYVTEITDDDFSVEDYDPW